MDNYFSYPCMKNFGSKYDEKHIYPSANCSKIEHTHSSFPLDSLQSLDWTHNRKGVASLLSVTAIMGIALVMLNRSSFLPAAALARALVSSNLPN